jgi:hypothetical protein
MCFKHVYMYKCSLIVVNSLCFVFNVLFFVTILLYMDFRPIKVLFCSDGRGCMRMLAYVIYVHCVHVLAATTSVVHFQLVIYDCKY